MRDKTWISERAKQIIIMTAEFCNQYLDDEYKQLCEKMVMKMSRKRNVPYLSGRIEIWAASIVYAIGQINFLFDQSFEPCVNADEICDYFGTSKSTTAQKAKIIRDMFKLGYWDDEFSTTRVQEDNPLSKLVMMDGLIVPIDFLSKKFVEKNQKKTIRDNKQKKMDDFT